MAEGGHAGVRDWLPRPALAAGAPRPPRRPTDSEGRGVNGAAEGVSRAADGPQTA
jgi:hypothetical protein